MTLSILQVAADAPFRELLESAPDPIIITDVRGCVVLINRQAEVAFGYPRDALIGQPVEILVPECLRAVHVEHRRAYCATPRTRPMGQGLQLAARRRDGTELPVEIALSPVSQEAQFFVICTVRDVSERRALERQKDQLVATLRHVLDGVIEAVFAFNSRGQLILTNPAACKLLERPAEKLIGCRIQDVFRWEDEAGRLIDEDEYAFYQTLSGSSPVIVRDRFLRRPDGRRIAVSVSSALVADQGQDFEMIVQLVRDIEHERQVEQLKDQVISLVSHELRTPIGHIKGFSSSLLEEDVEFEEATWRDFVSEIDREADRLTALVRNLLDMSKIESGAIARYPEPLIPSSVTAHALQTVENITADREVLVDVEDDLPQVLGDASQLERVLVNLIENAVKYSDANTRIEIRANACDGVVEWSVRDHGHGIPLDFRERIFDRFVRAPFNDRRVPGTGLGLPICKGIVEAHGGRLWLETPEGGGSRFVFTIPVAN